ncbi:MAG: AIR carboxylase family protein [Planctomycetota bacterium]
MAFAVILMGSMSDRPFAEPITTTLDKLGITYERRAASAHKSARYMLDLLPEYEGSGEVARTMVRMQETRRWTMPTWRRCQW